MAKYIYEILKSQMVILWSWGFDHPVALPDNKGLSFLVNGRKYKGKVIVEYDEGMDAFSVTIDKTKTDGIYLDMLVDYIDSMVETDTTSEVKVNSETIEMY